MKKPTLTLLAGAAVLAVALVAFSRQGGTSLPKSDGGTLTERTKDAPTYLPSTPASRTSITKPRNLTGLAKAVESPHAGDDPQNQSWVDTRLEELDRLSSMSDNESLQTILAELGNSQSEIRAGALSAARSFGSRDAIPWLEKYAAATSDTAEKKALEEAIEYLRLPTMIEHLESVPESEEEE